MGLGLLLIPSLGGYWFLRHANFTRFEIQRSSGYHLLFRSALVGIILAFIAHAIASLVNLFVPQIRSIMYDYISVNYIDTAAFSIVLAFASPPLLNMFYDQKRAVRKAAETYGDLIELLITDSIERRKMVEISLRTGKAYIGYALHTSITRPGDSDVTLVPMASGYRSEETRELRITTHYSPIIKEWISRQDSPSISHTIRDFKVVLPRSEVCSARLFDPAVYRLFQQSRRRPQGA